MRAVRVVKTYLKLNVLTPGSGTVGGVIDFQINWTRSLNRTVETVINKRNRALKKNVSPLNWFWFLFLLGAEIAHSPPRTTPSLESTYPWFMPITCPRVWYPPAAKCSLYRLIFMVSSHSFTELQLLKSGMALSISGGLFKLRLGERQMTTDRQREEGRWMGRQKD